eukprot:295317-Chlamydomonas_euryale.AAC.1
MQSVLSCNAGRRRHSKALPRSFLPKAAAHFYAITLALLGVAAPRHASIPAKEFNTQYCRTPTPTRACASPIRVALAGCTEGAAAASAAEAAEAAAGAGAGAGAAAGAARSGARARAGAGAGAGCKAGQDGGRRNWRCIWRSAATGAAACTAAAPCRACARRSH